MKTFLKPQDAIKWSKERLYQYGYEVETEKWQGIKPKDSMWEIMNHSFQMFIPNNLDELANEIRPNLPWADEHFVERIGGYPVNPPPSHINWPFAQKDNNEFISNKKFSHTYPERIWPKFAGDLSNTEKKEGIRFSYGDLYDVIKLLIKEPNTRQAFLPIWFPEDTGVVHGERVPCTIGYHFMRRNGYFHMSYFIRSCDIVRHFRDDIYLACRKLLWILSELKNNSNEWENIKPGYYSMYIVSLHCFKNEKGILKQKNI